MNKQNPNEHPIHLYGQCYAYKGHILDMIDWNLWIARKHTNITPGQEKSIEVCRGNTMYEIMEYIDSHKNQDAQQGPPKWRTFSYKKNLKFNTYFHFFRRY